MVLPFVQEDPDEALVRALRAGDEQTFARIIDEWSPAMLRLARCYVSSEASAEDVVQEAWLAALRGLPKFEGRSRLKTWVLRIVVNIAKTAGEREHRAGPLFSPLGGGGPTVDARNFNGPDEPDARSWRSPPASWPALPEGEVLTTEAFAVVSAALAGLPRSQRAVIALRDLDGYEAAEVCEALGITAANQRVLLHRARAAVRQKIEAYFLDGRARTAGGRQPW
jgi:RNA polymerase sigma-70 factor (ECF subfamily)